MKKMLLKRHKSHRFEKSDLREITDELKNPVRGWYRIYTFSLENELDELTWSEHLLGEQEDSLVLLRINLGAYRDKDIDDDALMRADCIVSCFVNQGKDIILRFAYDFEGKGMESEPRRFAQVEKHLEQLLPLIEKHSKFIYIYQGILLGSWGEMHSSKFLTPAYICKLEEKLSQVTLGEMEEERIYRVVRRPVFWRILHSEKDINIAMHREKVGLYNDAILGSETDLGTYGEEDRIEWEEPWNRQKEMDFLHTLCRYVPNGGEVVGAEDGRQYTLEETVDVFCKIHVSYLNRSYDRKVLDSWKDCKWEKEDSWNGVNGWDYIGRHLGYRFYVRDIHITTTKEKKECFQIKIRNTGFSNLYQEAELFLEYENPDGTWEKELIPCDMQRVDSKKDITIFHQRTMQKGNYYLSMRRKWDKRRILFANEADDKGRVYLGRII